MTETVYKEWTASPDIDYYALADSLKARVEANRETPKKSKISLAKYFGIKAPRCMPKENSPLYRFIVWANEGDHIVSVAMSYLFGPLILTAIALGISSNYEASQDIKLVILTVGIIGWILSGVFLHWIENCNGYIEIIKEKI